MYHSLKQSPIPRPFMSSGCVTKILTPQKIVSRSSFVAKHPRVQSNQDNKSKLLVGCSVQYAARAKLIKSLFYFCEVKESKAALSCTF